MASLIASFFVDELAWKVGSETVISCVWVSYLGDLVVLYWELVELGLHDCKNEVVRICG